MRNILVATAITIAGTLAFSNSAKAQFATEHVHPKLLPQIEAAALATLADYNASAAPYGYSLTIAGWWCDPASMSVGTVYVLFNVYYYGILVYQVSDPFQFR